MFELFNLPKTVTKKTQRVGRGEGSNRGKNSGKGHKGQNKHGQGTRFGFEGGQKTLIRRTPKFRGFKAREVKDLVVLNLGVIDKFFDSGETVSLLSLQSKGLANQFIKKVRIINSGTFTKKVSFDNDDNIYLTKGAKLIVNNS